VPAACQELAHGPLIACAYLSKSLILATAPHGAPVVLSDFCSGARLRFAPRYCKDIELNCLVRFAVARLGLSESHGSVGSIDVVYGESFD
jgi:hypothetical protein